jgi:hypothetical protein
LILATHFGVLGLGLVATGSRALLIRSKPAFFAAIGFAFPLLAFLAVNENWTQKDKWGIVTMTYFPLLVLVALGLTALAIGERRSRTKAWLAFIAVATGAILVRPILLNARAPEDSRFRVLWSEKLQQLNAEEPAYLELERHLLSGMDWSPGYRFLERIPIRPARPTWAVLKEEFRTRDVTRRAPSIAERIMTPLIPPSEIPWLPAAALPHGPRRGPTDAVVHEIDLSRSPATAWKSGASVLSAPLSDESTTHLRVGAPPIPLVVPWRSEPVHVYLVDVPEHGSTILVLVRDVPFELSRSRRLATHLYSAERVVLNYPIGRRLMLLDVLTADPARYYLFDVDADHGALAIRTY